MSIGGKQGRRPYLSPGAKEANERANTRIEHLVAAANVKTKNALRVDGVPCLIWNRSPSPRRLCTCSMKAPGSGEINDFSGADNEYRILGVSTDPQPHGDRFQEGKQTVRIQTKSVFKDTGEDWNLNGQHQIESRTKKRADVDREFSATTDEDALLDLAALHDEVAGPSSPTDSPSFAKDFLTGETVKCPVCAATSWVDAWNLRSGVRPTMAFLDDDKWSSNGQLDTDARPNILVLEAGEFVEWTFRLPRYFTVVLACRAWESHIPVTDPIVLPAQSNAVATPRALQALDGTGGDVRFRLVVSKRTLLTHCDAEIVFKNPDYLQFPQLNIPFDREYLDFNTSASVELGADVALAPGDIINDFKYRRVWRTTNVNLRKTAEGRTLSQTADLRMVMVTEPYHTLDVFAGTTEDGDRKRFRGVLERWQSGAR